MPLPSSGNALSMGDINVELGRARTTASTALAGANTPTAGSLFGLAVNPINKIAPHRISEWYGYSNCPPYGEFVTSYCLGCDLYFTYTDGSCGTFDQFIESNSSICGGGCGGGGYLCDCGFGCSLYNDPCFFFGCSECFF